MRPTTANSNPAMMPDSPEKLVYLADRSMISRTAHVAPSAMIGAISLAEVGAALGANEERRQAAEAGRKGGLTRARRHRQLLDQARENLAALGVSGALLVLDRMPF